MLTRARLRTVRTYSEASSFDAVGALGGSLLIVTCRAKPQGKEGATTPYGLRSIREEILTLQAEETGRNTPSWARTQQPDERATTSNHPDTARKKGGEKMF